MPLVGHENSELIRRNLRVQRDLHRRRGVTATQDGNAVTAGPIILETDKSEPSSGRRRSRASGTANPSCSTPRATTSATRTSRAPASSEDGETRYWMNTHARGRGPAAQPVRARCPLRLRGHRLRREPRLHRAGLLRHRPALRPVRRRALLLAGLAGRPAHLEPRAARRRDAGLLLGPARRLDRLRASSTVSTRSTSTAPTPEAQAVRSTTGSRARRELGPKPQVLPTKQRGTWTGVFEVYDVDQSKRGDMLVTDRARAALADAAPARPSRGKACSTARTPFERTRMSANTIYDGPDVVGQRPRLRPRAVHQPALRAAATSGRSRVASSCSTTRNRIAVVWELFQRRLAHARAPTACWTGSRAHERATGRRRHRWHARHRPRASPTELLKRGCPRRRSAGARRSRSTRRSPSSAAG